FRKPRSDSLRYGGCRRSARRARIARTLRPAAAPMPTPPVLDCWGRIRSRPFLLDPEEPNQPQPAFNRGPAATQMGGDFLGGVAVHLSQGDRAQLGRG